MKLRMIPTPQFSMILCGSHMITRAGSSEDKMSHVLFNSSQVVAVFKSN